MSYFAPLGEGELLNHHWGPMVLLQAGPVEMHYIWNGTCTVARGQKVGVLVWHIPHPVHLFTPDSAPASSQRVRYAHQVKFLKLLTSLSSRPDGGFLFSTSMTFSPTIGLEDDVAHI